MCVCVYVCVCVCVGRGGGGGNQKLKEDVQFLKANLSALWDIVGELQKRASEERQDESEELVVSLGLKKAESWGPALKNQFDSQVYLKNVIRVNWNQLKQFQSVKSYWSNSAMGSKY